MDVNWLRQTLKRLPGDMELYIEIDGQLHKLCGKINLTMLTYVTPDDPETEKGEQAIVFKPCKCGENEDHDERIILN